MTPSESPWVWSEVKRKIIKSVLGSDLLLLGRSVPVTGGTVSQTSEEIYDDVSYADPGDTGRHL